MLHQQTITLMQGMKLLGMARSFAERVHLPQIARKAVLQKMIDVLRLRHEAGLSHRRIAASLQISRSPFLTTWPGHETMLAMLRNDRSTSPKYARRAGTGSSALSGRPD